ncbi:MAG: hypothetical protein AAGA62_00030 [Bacteroidota bacterium]
MKKTNPLAPLQQLPPEFNLQEMETILQRVPYLPTPQPLTFWTVWKGAVLKFISSLGLIGICIFGWWQFNHSSPTAEVITLSQPPVKTSTPSKANSTPFISSAANKEDSLANTPSLRLPSEPTALTSSLNTKPAPAPAPTASLSSLAVPATPQEPRTEEISSNQREPTPAQSYPFPPASSQGLPATTPDSVIKKGLFGDYIVDENAHDFSEIPLAKLRRILRKNLLRDGLITSRKDTVKLHLAPNTIYLNGEELMPDKVLTYRKIAQDFQLGTGPTRYVYITPKGIAVGDFGPTSFRGSSLGSYSLIKME